MRGWGGAVRLHPTPAGPTSRASVALVGVADGAGGVPHDIARLDVVRGVMGRVDDEAPVEHSSALRLSQVGLILGLQLRGVATLGPGVTTVAAEPVLAGVPRLVQLAGTVRRVQPPVR